MGVKKLRRDHVNRARNADHAARTRESLAHSTDSLIIKHGGHIFGKIHEVRKGIWAFFS